MHLWILRSGTGTAALALASLLVAASADAGIIPANFVTNGDFATSLAGWSTVSAEPLWLAEDWQGDPGSGSARVVDQLFPSNNVYLTQCIATGGASGLVVQAEIRNTPIDQGSGLARIALSFRDGPDCETAGVVGDYTIAINESVVGDWTLQSAVVGAPQGAVAAVLQLDSVHLDSTGGWIADFDDVFVPEPAGAAPAALGALAVLRGLSRGTRRRAACPGAACAVASSRRREPRPRCARRSGA